MFRIGELDQKIDFWRECNVQDEDLGGLEASVKTLFAGVWAKARPLSGSEIERFDKLNATELTFFVTRYKPEVKEDDYISWQGVNYNIRHIPSVGPRSLYSEFYAERGVAQ